MLTKLTFDGGTINYVLLIRTYTLKHEAILFL